MILITIWVKKVFIWRVYPWRLLRNWLAIEEIKKLKLLQSMVLTLLFFVSWVIQQIMLKMSVVLWLIVFVKTWSLICCPHFHLYTWGKKNSAAKAEFIKNCINKSRVQIVRFFGASGAVMAMQNILS
jgi:hypothetical protein